MPNKYYLREDRKAVKPTMEEPNNKSFWKPSISKFVDSDIWRSHLRSLPALDVDPDYMKTLSPGWFEGEERYEQECWDKWEEISKDEFDNTPYNKRLTIVAPQEASKHPEWDKTMQRPWQAAIDYCNQNHKGSDRTFKKCFESFIAGVNWKHENEFATPQPVTRDSVKIDSIEEGLCLIIGKADRGLYNEADPHDMCFEILGLAKQTYALSQAASDHNKKQ